MGRVREIRPGPERVRAFLCHQYRLAHRTDRARAALMQSVGQAQKCQAARILLKIRDGHGGAERIRTAE